MIISIKNLFFISLVIIGYYFFYIEYEKLISFDYLDQKEQIKEVNKLKTGKKLNFKSTELNKTKQKDQDKDIVKLERIDIIVSKGDTFLSILKKFSFSEEEIFKIINEIKPFYNLKKLKINDKIIFYSDINEKVKKIEISLGIDSILLVNIGNTIYAEKKEFDRVPFQESYEFKIVESLYADGLKNNLPPDILIKLIKLFSFDLDFQRDIIRDTLVSVSYGFNEIKENNKIEYKDINYALISIRGKNLEYFKFLTEDGHIDYFNREGKNVKKSILKTPLDGARLSSSFGMRKHPISGYNKMHKGVDFAAPKGTPIYAGGNGIIEYAGNNGGYGKYIRIRHNNEYKTAYAHLSGFRKGISKGVRVNQGEVIGYVGNTGNSTGPHLHYEIIYQNKQINPLTLKLPSGKILKGKELERFKKEYKKIYANHLHLLFE